MKFDTHFSRNFALVSVPPDYWHQHAVRISLFKVYYMFKFFIPPGRVMLIVESFGCTKWMMVGLWKKGLCLFDSNIFLGHYSRHSENSKAFTLKSFHTFCGRALDRSSDMCLKFFNRRFSEACSEVNMEENSPRFNGRSIQIFGWLHQVGWISQKLCWLTELEK